MSTHLATALMSFHLQPTLSDPHLCLILHLHAATNSSIPPHSKLLNFSDDRCYRLTSIGLSLYTTEPTESVTWRNEIPFGAIFAKFSMEYAGTCVRAMSLLDSASLQGVSFAPRPSLSRLIWYGRMTKDAQDYYAAARRETHLECGRYPARVSPPDDKMTGDETGPHVMCGHYPRYAREQHAQHQ